MSITDYNNMADRLAKVSLNTPVFAACAGLKANFNLGQIDTFL
jgi:hypothetical protein